MKEHFVITVGREYGSGGRAIAKLVAQKLNVPFYDKELLTLAAQKSGICQEIFEHNDEKTTVSDMLPVTAVWAIVIGAILGVLLPLTAKLAPRARPYLPSAMGLGLAWVMPFARKRMGLM